MNNWFNLPALGAMIFGRRMGCVTSESTNKMYQIDQFVKCIRDIFVESTNLQVIPPMLAYKLKLPIWKRFERAASKALELGFKYVNDNVHQSLNGNSGVLKQMIHTGAMDMDLKDISRIIVDMFIASADTVSK